MPIKVQELVMMFLRTHGSTILVCMTTFFLLNLAQSMMAPDARRRKAQGVSIFS